VVRCPLSVARARARAREGELFNTQHTHHLAFDFAAPSPLPFSPPGTPVGRGEKIRDTARATDNGQRTTQPATELTFPAETLTLRAVPNVYQFKDFEGSSHRILIDLIRSHAGQGGVLLDLGAAGGELGGAVRDQFRRTLGFECDIDRIGSLQHNFDQVVIIDLERLKRLPAPVDAIVMADVLEHLRDPAAALRLARQALTGDGRIFLSVPNIANITVRIGLLFGVFEYRDRGILDSTHLRFYTKRTIRQEIENAGFSILAMRGSSVPVRLIIGSMLPEPLLRGWEKLLTVVTRVWTALFAYQIILVARPNQLQR
jgi:SAM-dependent methyltransferase